MRPRKKWALLLGVAFAGLALSAPAAEEPARAVGGPLVVVDADGKEHKLPTWQFTTGARRLAWLAPADRAPEKDKPVGQEAFAFREADGTRFPEGVLTLVPMERMRTLEFDEKMQVAKLTTATGKGDGTQVLTGTTALKGGVNEFVLEGTAEGSGGEKTKFLAGVEKGVKSVKFPAPKVEPLPPGVRPALLTTRRDRDGTTTHKMHDFLPLYRFADGREILSPQLYCKDLKADMAKVTKFTRTAGQGDEVVWIISQKGAEDETERVLPTATIDGKEATLVGFIARVPAGYKLFPAVIIQEVEFDVK